MNFIIAVNHPAQYHLFKIVYNKLSKNNHKVYFVIKDKDILSNLMDNEGVRYHKLTKKRVGKGRFSVLFKGFFDLIIQNINLFWFAYKKKPDLMFGTDYSITHVGKLLGISTIVFNEDDFEINKFFCRLAYPFTDCIVSPIVCDVGRYNQKKIGYNGFQKLAYLHPNVFKPDITVVKKYFSVDKQYFLIRLVSFSAGHDIEMKHGGLNTDNIKIIIDLLSKHGNVFISSESKMPEQFASYKLNINTADIHHIMAFASMIIADSQSMIVEASMLGTPSIRYNSFVGKISVLEELEQKYNLTTGIQYSHPEKLILKLNEFLSEKDVLASFRDRREKMLMDKIDVSAFITWFVENYPDSDKKMRDNPDYQYNFK